MAQIGVIIFAASMVVVAFWRVAVRSGCEGNELAPVTRLTLPVLLPAYIAVTLVIVLLP